MIMIIFASAVYYKWPVTIEQQFTGELHRSHHTTPVTININMKMNRKFLSENKVSGTVIVGDKEYTIYNQQKDNALFMSFSNIQPFRKLTNIFRDESYRLTDTHYDSYLNSTIKTTTIHISRDFTSLSGYLYNDEDGYTSFQAPANSLEQH